MDDIHINELVTNEQYKLHLREFAEYLNSDTKRWIILQIKQAMISGQTHKVVCKIKKNHWKKGKTIKNFWRKQFILPEDKRYYHQKSNVLITDPKLRTVIDFLTDIGLKWYPMPTLVEDKLIPTYNYIIAHWSRSDR